jgi:1,4-dihydroxy-2-naphthoate polyprenyltransferase
MYALSVLGAFALLVPMAWMSTPALLMPLLLAPVALRLQRDFALSAPGLAYNAILVRTFKLELGYAALLAVGAVAGRLAA